MAKVALRRSPLLHGGLRLEIKTDALNVFALTDEFN